MITMVSTQRSLQLWWFWDIFLHWLFLSQESLETILSEILVGSLSHLVLNWVWETMVTLAFCTFTFSSAFLYWQLDNWSGILFWFSCFSLMNALTNCSGIVRLPSIIICSYGILEFQFFLLVFLVAFRWQIIYLAFVSCSIFCICYGLCIWRLLFLAFLWQLCLIFTAVSLFTLVAIKSQQERNSRKAPLKLFVSWPCQLPKPVEGFDNAFVPEHIRDFLWAFSV